MARIFFLPSIIPDLAQEAARFHYVMSNRQRVFQNSISARCIGAWVFL